MSLSEAAPQLLGKRIVGVIEKRSDRLQVSQVFLIFDDDTYYELYSQEPICGAGGIDRGGMQAVLDYMPEREVVVQAYVDPSRGVQRVLEI